MALFTRASLPVNSLRELVADARANPGKLSYASVRQGSTKLLAMEWLGKEAALGTMVHVSYRGAAPTIPHLLGGVLGMAVIAVPAIQAHLKSQGMVAVGLGTAACSPVLSDVPTVAEQGLPNYVVDGWFGVIGRPGCRRPMSSASTMPSSPRWARRTCGRPC